MDKPFDKSSYEDKAKLAASLETKTPRQLSKEIGVSYKLINAWAIRHGLIRRTPETQLP
jgi:hypothetical protein